MKREFNALFFIFTQLKIARSIILAIFNTNYLYST
nr:MAG TPA: hypothetical protein [Caudoviricetes sp.]